MTINDCSAPISDSYPEFVPRYDCRRVTTSTGPFPNNDVSKRLLSESGYSDTLLSPSSLRSCSMSSFGMDEVTNRLNCLQLRGDSDGQQQDLDRAYAWDVKTYDYNRISGNCAQVPLKSNYFDSMKPLDGMFKYEPKSREADYNSDDDDVPRRLHVSNIPFRFREFDLFQLFGKYGAVTDVEIIYNDKGSKGFGFVTMARSKEADLARFILHGWSIQGRVIEVNLATPKITPSKRPSVPGLSPSSRRIDALSSSSYYELPPDDQTAYEMIIAQTKLAEAHLKVLQLQQRSMRNRFNKAGDEDVDRKFSGSTVEDQNFGGAQF